MGLCVYAVQWYLQNLFVMWLFGMMRVVIAKDLSVERCEACQGFWACTPDLSSINTAMCKSVACHEGACGAIQVHMSVHPHML